jgi:hypothetical protein
MEPEPKLASYNQHEEKRESRHRWPVHVNQVVEVGKLWHANTDYLSSYLAVDGCMRCVQAINTVVNAVKGMLNDRTSG